MTVKAALREGQPVFRAPVSPHSGGRDRPAGTEKMRMRVGQLTTAGARRTRATALAPPEPGDADPTNRIGSGHSWVNRAPSTVARPARSEIPAPIILDRYRLVRRLGTGGFGTVWMARDERLEREVAIKILPRQLVAAGRFEREAHAAARLSHPGIVTLYEAASDDEGAYLVSELVRGATLERALAAGRLSDRAIVDIAMALCEALSHAHAHGVVHRDVKPSNILLPAHGASAKLTDFGVARVLGGDTLTRTGELVGTAAYMAPEQAEGREVGPAADLYSLALVLYEALTGLNPIPAVAQTLGPHRTRRLALHLPPLRRQRRELPRELGQAVDLALRPRPRERGTMDELHDALAVARERVADIPGVVGAPRFSREEREERTERDEATRRERTGSRRRSLSTPGGDAPERAGPVIVALASGPSLPTRAVAAASGAWLAAWSTSHLLHPGTMPAATGALLAAIVLVLLPRLGWLALVLALLAGLAIQGHPGDDLVLGLAALLPVAVLAGDGTLWPVPALAPALAVIGCAGAWPALAGWASSAWRRAALGALGWAWLSLGGALAGHALYVRRPAGLAPASRWAGSAPEAVHHVLVPLLSNGLPAGAAVWALAAAVLPFVGSRRSPAREVLALAAWAVALVVATVLALQMSGAGVAVPGGGLLAVGVPVSVLAALGSRQAGRIAARRQWSSAWPGLA